MDANKEELDNKDVEVKEEKKEDAGTEENKDSAGTEAKTYDEAYIESLKAQFEAEKTAAVEAARKELTDKAAEEAKLSGMTEEEKAQYEAGKKEQDLADREAALALRELQAETKSLLAEQGLPVDVMESVIGKDLETTKQNIANFKKHVDTTVNAQVTARLKGVTPSQGTGADNADMADVATEFGSFL